MLGHAPRLMRDPLGFLTGLPAHGDIVDIMIGAMRVSVVCHPRLVHQMLLNEPALTAAMCCPRYWPPATRTARL